MSFPMVASQTRPSALRSTAPLASTALSTQCKTKPLTNTADLLEIWSPCGQLSRQRGGGRYKCGTKPRKPRLDQVQAGSGHLDWALRPVPECFDESTDQWNGVEEKEEAWTCRRCTFLNAGALHACEMCELPAGILPMDDSGFPFNHIPGNDMKESLCSFDASVWPSLCDAIDASWDSCEVCSNSSSWLDLGENVADGTVGVDDSCFFASYVVVQEHLHPAGSPSPERGAEVAPTLSWADKTANGCQPQSPYRMSVLSKPAQPPMVPIPPRSRRQHSSRKVSAADSEESEDPEELDLLMQRRLAPRGRAWQKRCR